jgi:hypothetical protein
MWWQHYDATNLRLARGDRRSVHRLCQFAVAAALLDLLSIRISWAGGYGAVAR